MEDIRREVLAAEVNRAVLEYWDEVDSRWGADAHERYVENGRFSKMVGKAEIKAFYDWRKSRGPRSTFHIVLNMKVDVKSETEATARYIMMLYAKDGPPIHDAHAPNTISNAVEELEKVEGVWKIKSKMVDTVFRGGEPTTIMPDEMLEKMRT